MKEELRKSRILVTGATGLIGYNLVCALMEKKNTEVIALSRDERKLAECFSRFSSASDFQYIAHDVSQELPDMGAVDIIFHAAGPMERKIIDNFPVNVIFPNLVGTINCMEYARKHAETQRKPRVVLFSSITVYGNNTKKDRTVCEKDTNIADFLESKNAPYSQSKRMAEVIATSYARQYGIDAVIARLSTVYGETFFRPDTAFFQFYDSAFKGEDIVIGSRGIARRDNIYIDDAVAGLIVVAENGVSGEVYNISSNGEGENFAAIDEIAARVLYIANQKEHSGKQKLVLTYREDMEKPRNPGLILDNQKLKSLGWSLKVSLSEGLERTYEKMVIGNNRRNNDSSK